MPPKKDMAAADSNTGAKLKSSPSTPTLATSEPSFNLTMPQEYLTILLQQMQQSHNELCEKLVTATQATTHQRDRHFAGCKLSFSGAEDSVEDALEVFVDGIQTYKDCAKISDENAVRGLSFLFTGLAATWWNGVRKSIKTWNEAITDLQHAFGKRKAPFLIFREIFREEQGDEKTEIFICKIRALIAQLPYSFEENIQIDIVYGLLNRRIRKRVPRDDVKSFNDLFRKTRSAEDSLAEVNETNGTTSVNASNVNAVNGRTVNRNNGNDRNSENKTSTASSDNKQLKQKTFTRQSATNENKVSNDTNSTAKPKSSRFCNYCKLFGHNKDNCKWLLAKRSDTTVTSTDNSDNAKSEKFSCYGCGTPGVVRANCPRCKQDPGAAGSSGGVAFCAFSTEEEATTTESTTPVDICARETNTHIYTLTLDEYLLLGQQADRPRPILPITVCGREGRAVVDTGAERSVAGESLYKLMKNSGKSFTPSTLNIKYAKGRSEVEDILSINITIVLKGKPIPMNFIIFPEATGNQTLLGMDFIFRSGLKTDFDNHTWSFRGEPDIQYELQYEHDPVAIAACKPTEASQKLRDNEGITLNNEQRDKLSSLLDRHRDTFNLGGEPTTYAVHHIELINKNIQPISVPPYRLPEPKKEALRVELEKMLKDDVIEECESPWSAPVVLVPKKDNTIRVCIDYRKLNAVTKPDRYPLPRVDDILHGTGKFKYISALDLRAGYWQVPVAMEDRDKTSFVTPLGMYRFKRMPMGLRNSGSTFQRLMDRFRSNLPNVTLLAYLDDVLILSDSFEKHLQDMEAVFQRLKLFKLRVNREKSTFACESVKYLGHILSADGIQPDIEKTKAISEMKEPLNDKHLKTFIQTCSWFRKFIPDFAKIARPLTMLLKKNQNWIWGEDQVKAFKELKKCLTSAPILRQVDYTLPFTLRVDASGYALGAVLLQGQGYDERPVEYASRLLTSAERNYADQKRRPHESYNIGDKVLLKTHVLSNQTKGITSKFAPRRDGPYTISKIVSPTTYMLTNNGETVGKYHVSDLTTYHQKSGDEPAEPIMPQRKRGRPPKRAPATPTPPATGEKKRGRPRKKQPVCRPMGEDVPMARRGSL
ncbi:uncharacterized protein LOC134661628 [Cydia amplana]|uniref:uncharacterized protein LOC134661628 n=1 Tax=Cydia amplana TaxID=1869771 RepID=UPI002FE64AB0